MASDYNSGSLIGAALEGHLMLSEKGTGFFWGTMPEGKQGVSQSTGTSTCSEESKYSFVFALILLFFKV